MKKTIAAALVLMGMVTQCAFSEEYWSVSAYYDKGKAYYDSGQYTNAIGEFKKALRVSPYDSSSKIQMINAYLARATYYNNKASDYSRAANDVRSALFYLKYYDTTAQDTLTSQAISSAQYNLDLILQHMNFNKSAKNRFNTAKTLRAQGEFAAAAYEFLAAMSDNSLRKDSLIALGDIYSVLGVNDISLAYYEQALDLDDTDNELHLKLARTYEKAGKTDEATKHYNIALTRSEENEDILSSLLNIWLQKVAQNPNDPESHANLGAIYQKQGDYTKALDEYKLAEKLNPSNPTTRLNLGTLYQIKKEYDSAIEAYNSVLALYPNNAFAHLYKAQCLQAKGLKDESLVEYKLAMKADPKNQDIKAEMYDLLKDTMTPEEIMAYLYANSGDMNASTYYRFAWDLHKSGKIKDSIKFYEQTIKLDPNFTEAYLNLAQAYKQDNNLDMAKTTLENAKTRFPADKTILNQYNSVVSEASFNLYNAASALFEKKDYNGAIAKYKEITPATSESLVGIAASYQAMEDFKSAASFYKQALAVDANNTDILYYLASALTNINDNANAKVYLKKALAISPNKKEAKDLLNYIIAQENVALLDKVLELYDAKNYTAAMSTANKIIAQDAKNSTAYYYRALIYDIQKNYAGAIADYKRAVQYNSELDVAYYSMAVDYDLLKNYKEAVRNYKKFLSMTKETNDYTQYAKKRAADLKAYDN